LHHALGVGIAGLGQFGDVVEEVKDQQGLLEAFGSGGAGFGVAQQVDQRLDVVAAEHGAQQFGSLHTGNQTTGQLALGNLGQEFGLDLGGVVNAGGNTIGQQVYQESFFAGRRVLQQLDESLGLLLRQGQRRDAECSALGNMLAVGFKHG